MARYEPLLKIASGGTASVWVGATADSRDLVAIKRPHAHLADDPEFRRALAAEAKIASRLRHANAVDVRDVESDESGVVLVMDWIEGASLSDLIRSWSKEPPARPEAVAVRVVLDACAGLHALHELRDDAGALLGCVHRDVSPANVLVGIDGVARITDFGLAKPLFAVERTTSEGALRGKLGYMAPEYIRGKEIDARVDVFAAGVVLWEALARKRLFRGDNDAATLEHVQRSDPPPLGDFDAVLARALAKDPSERFATIADFAAELERVAREKGLLATQDEVTRSFGTELLATIHERRTAVNALAPRKKRSRAPLAIAALVAVTSLLTAAVVFGREPAPIPARTPRTAERLSAALADAVRGRAEPQRVAHAPAAAAPRPAAPEPGKKVPRPNPYPAGTP